MRLHIGALSEPLSSQQQNWTRQYRAPPWVRALLSEVVIGAVVYVHSDAHPSLTYGYLLAKNKPRSGSFRRLQNHEREDDFQALEI